MDRYRRTVGDDWRLEAQREDRYRTASLDLVRDKINGIDQLVLDVSREPYRIPHLAAEASYWLCAVDESLWRLNGYASDRDADDGGRLLQGIRHARNAATHSLIEVAKSFPSPFFAAGSSEFVKAVSSAPLWVRDPVPLPPNPSAHAKASREVFDAHLAGESVGNTLAAAEEWLRSAVTRPLVLSLTPVGPWRRIHFMGAPARRPK